MCALVEVTYQTKESQLAFATPPNPGAPEAFRLQQKLQYTVLMKLAMTLVFFMSIVLSFGQSGFSMSDMQRDLMLSTGNLLQNGEIKNELKLDREQSGKVNEILKEYKRRSNEISKPGRGNDLSAGLSSFKNISELNAETHKKVAEVLNV